MTIPCLCNYLVTGRCWLKVDSDWKEKNTRILHTKETINPLDAHGIALNELARLAEKRNELIRHKVESTSEIECAMKLTNPHA